MNITGLSLETTFFEDYQSFLTDVLGFDRCEINDNLMHFEMNQVCIEIRKKTGPDYSLPGLHMVFSLSSDDYVSLRQRLSFYDYRKVNSRFEHEESEKGIRVLDPDGREWRFILA
jgi:hypothetical protein